MAAYEAAHGSSDHPVMASMRIEFVRARHEDDDEDPGNA
jgi:hypothetical protein